MVEKSSNNKFNKYLSVVLAVVILVSAGIYAYTNLIEKELTKSETNLPRSTHHEETLLTIMVGSKLYNYTLNNLTALGNISGQGSYINKFGKITGPNNYTGVSMSVLLNSIQTLPNNYTFHAIASDGYSLNYSMDEVNGHVLVYNETGKEIGSKNLTMIVAYEENGAFLNETTNGPLRIAFIDTQSAITNSSLWLSSLIMIEFI